MTTHRSVQHTTRRRSRAGFTLVELLITLAIAAIVAAVTIPQLMKTRDDSLAASAQAIERQISDIYNQWSGLGGTHATAASHDLTRQLLNALTSVPDDQTGYPRSWAAATAAAGAIGNATTPVLAGALVTEPRRFRPLPGTIRTRLPKTLGARSVDVDGTGSGTAQTEMVYDDTYFIRFTPTSNNTGTWSVGVIIEG